MRRAVGLAVTLVLVAAAVTGCHYRKPPLREWYDQVELGMTREQVIEELGDPTVSYEREMMYLYDDPDDPARFRFVLSAEDEVVERYFETKEELCQKAEEIQEQLVPPPTVPGEDEPRAYPGGPLPQFNPKGMPEEELAPEPGQ